MSKHYVHKLFYIKKLVPIKKVYKKEIFLLFLNLFFLNLK